MFFFKVNYFPAFILLPPCLVCKPFGAVSMDEVWFWGDTIMEHW